MQLRILASGDIVGIYAEAIAWRELGQVTIRRASHVEPTLDGLWTADLKPVGGPVLGPFALRSMALSAESRWLEQRFFSGPFKTVTPLQAEGT